MNHPHDSVDSRLLIGFLHLGASESGIRRHGETLAAELAKRPGIEVLEASTNLVGGGIQALRRLGRAARVLRVADVIVLSHSPYRLWAGGRTRLLQLVVAALALRPSVILLHDVYPADAWRSVDWWALAVLGRLGHELIYQEEHERAVLATLPGGERITRVPHPIISVQLPSRAEARATLGVADETVVVSLIGWLHPRKNPESAVRALAELSPKTHLWIVGGVAERDEGYEHRLRALATALNVADQVHITGYVDEPELLLRLAATDIGLVPYRAMSASASLATLIAARKPIVANWLPVTRELVALAPDAIATCRCDDAREFARVIRQTLERQIAPEAFDVLLEVRSLERAAAALERSARQAAAR